MTTSAPAVQNDKQPSLAQLIQQMKPEIAKALPRHMNPDRMARIATTVLRQTPALARCTPESFLGALLTASQLGLEPGPTGDAYFVPFGNVCTFIPGYRGLIKLARNSGLLVDIWAEIVYENDVFKYTLGLRRDLQHEPAAGDRGKPIYVYAAAQLKDGGTPFVVLTVSEVEAIRARSRAGRNGPWVTDWGPMAKKTAVKQLAKWLPLSPEFNTATVLDETVRTSVGPLLDVQPDYVDGEVGDQLAVEPGQGGAGDDGEAGGQEPPADVMYVGKADLAKLANIRKAERYDDDEAWADYVFAAAGERVTDDSQLTVDGARKIIDLFNEDAAK